MESLTKKQLNNYCNAKIQMVYTNRDNDKLKESYLATNWQSSISFENGSGEN